MELEAERNVLRGEVADLQQEIADLRGRVRLAEDAASPATQVHIRQLVQEQQNHAATRADFTQTRIRMQETIDGWQQRYRELKAQLEANGYEAVA